jgi:hypothetical protein
MAGCHVDSPTAPPSELSGNSLKNRLHGTWRTVINSTKLSFLAFDATKERFMQQLDYDYNFTRELPGTFSLADSILTLTHDIHSQYIFLCHLQADTLVLQYGPRAEQALGPYVRISPTPNLEGWSTKIYPTSRHDFPNRLIWSLGAGDLGFVGMTYPWTDPNRYLLRMDTSSGVTASVAPDGVLAMDIHGGYIWTATDSAIQMRSVTDFAVIRSFAWRSQIPFGFDQYSPSGIVMSDDRCYLMVVCYPIDRGYLLQLSPTGAFISAVRANAVIKDLCLVNGRLFCVEGGEAFWELDPVSGMAINYYTVSGRPSFAHIGGIASSNGHMYITNDWDDLTLYTFELSPLATGNRPANQVLKLAGPARLDTDGRQSVRSGFEISGTTLFRMIHFEGWSGGITVRIPPATQ